MILLSLDLSTSCSGFSIFEDGKLQKYGAIPKQTYKLHSRDKYPKKSVLFAKLMADKVVELIREIQPDFIAIEEVSVGGKQGVLQVKSLPMLHGMVLYQIPDLLDSVYFIPCSGKVKSHGIEINGWRTKKGITLQKNGDYKKAAVKRANLEFGLELTDDDHDIADSLLIGMYFLTLGIENS